ncbi:Wzz/FepE/Etk N-terminal domain-containing protein [Marinomonas primoryensis]|uniref:Wzz/FepE/Etk N-terminal domain-containing protein n=1 Tax=Marinomonas primoryensis TaxID=178399 RepID=UPI0030DD1372
MTKGQLSPDQFEKKSVLEKNQFEHRDDEVDLKELVVALWQGKFTIIAVMVICTAIAIAYALLAKEKWTTEAIITEPQISDFSDYQKMVNDFQPVFDVYQDGTILISQQLNTFVLPKNLFQIYLQQYNSRSNQKDYISSFLDFREELKKISETTKGEEYRAQESKLYSEWYNKLTAVVINSKNQSESHSLQGVGSNAEKSFDFLNGYIQYVEKKARIVTIANLKAVIDSKQNELIQQNNMLTDQAKSRLQSEIELAVYALQIAKAAGIDKPQQNLGDQEIFAINIGSSALEAKVKVLDNLRADQLSLIEPRLQAINSKLNLLNALKVNTDVSFKTFQYIESPEKPLGRTSPKRPLIAVLGVLLGGLLGSFIVLVRFAFREK